MNQLFLAFAMVANMVAATQPFPVQFGHSEIGVMVTLRIDGHQVETTFAGKLSFRDQRHEWMSVCADVRSPIVEGQYFMMLSHSSAKFGGNVAKAGHIVAKYFRSAQTPEQCAGLQIAVWKAIEDGGRDPNFIAGKLEVQTDISTLAYAKAYYQAANDDAGGDAAFLQAGAGGGQSQLSTSL